MLFYAKKKALNKNKNLPAKTAGTEGFRIEDVYIRLWQINADFSKRIYTSLAVKGLIIF